MSVTEFLKGLPSYNETNFSKFQVDNNTRSPLKRPSVYIPTRDFPSEQVIVTETTSILLKYMQTHWNKKQSASKKRDHLSECEEPVRKRQRIDYSASSMS